MKTEGFRRHGMPILLLVLNLIAAAAFFVAGEPALGAVFLVLGGLAFVLFRNRRSCER
jgi:hypothetical protein